MKKGLLKPPSKISSFWSLNRCCVFIVLNYPWLAATPLETSRDTWGGWFRLPIFFILDLKIKSKKNVLWVIFLGKLVVLSLQKVINLPWTYEKLPCNGESYRGSAVREILRYKQTDKHTNILLLNYKDWCSHLAIKDISMHIYHVIKSKLSYL